MKKLIVTFTQTWGLAKCGSALSESKLWPVEEQDRTNRTNRCALLNWDKGGIFWGHFSLLESAQSGHHPIFDLALSFSGHGDFLLNNFNPICPGLLEHNQYSRGVEGVVDLLRKGSPFHLMKFQHFLRSSFFWQKEMISCGKECTALFQTHDWEESSFFHEFVRVFARIFTNTWHGGGTMWPELKFVQKDIATAVFEAKNDAKNT